MAIRMHPHVLFLPVILIVADWVFTLAALWLCFHALGVYLGPDVLITGFSVGIIAGVISMIPGGLGVQEGSMSSMYALLGVPFEHAILGAILFRVVYYFVPFLFSLGFYRQLLRETVQARTILDKKES